jgi:hypothetical protein
MSIPGSANPLLLASAAAAGGYTIDRSVRFNSVDSSYLNRTFTTATNAGIYTFSAWLKRSGLSDGVLFSGGTGTSIDTNWFGFASDSIALSFQDGSAYLTTTAVYRDPSAWYHVLVAVDLTQATASNRVKLYVNGAQITSFSSSTYPDQNGTYYINRANQHTIGARYRVSIDTYFNGYIADAHFIDGQALTPTSFGEFDTNGVWQPIEYAGTYGTNGFHLPFSDNSTAAALGTDTSGNGNNWTPNNLTVAAPAFSNPTNGNTPVYEITIGPTNDLSGTYVWSNAFDGTTSTTGLIGPITFTGATKPTWSTSQGVELMADGNGITASVNGGSQVALTSNAFVTISSGSSGTLNSIWIYGPTSASYIKSVRVDGVDISVKALLGKASDIDSLVDSPTNYGTDTGAGGEVRGNYATLNPLDRASIGTLSNGNLKWVGDGTGNYCNTRGTLALTGKVYFEAVINAASVACSIGVAPGTDYNKAITDTAATDYLGSSAWGVNSAVIGGAFGTCYSNGASAGSFTGANNDILMCAFDQATGKIWFGRNGSWLLSGNPATGSNPTFTIANTLTVYPASTVRGTDDLDVNFGQRPFAYTAPSGFKALCTTNLPEPTIADGSTAMDVALYTGNGSTQTISGLNFSPDFAWLKIRSNVGSHFLFDTVRGATNELRSNSTNAENSLAQSLTAFNSDGFSLGTDNAVNGSSDTYVAWTWDAGSSTVTNTEGSITSQVRANASAGFSVVTTNGTTTAGTIGHGLGVAPAFIIAKTRDAAVSWIVYHTSTGKDQYLILNSTNGAAVATNLWGTSSPTSSVFGVDGNGGNNYNGSGMVYYCFAPVDGYSSAFSFTGTGTDPGPFVYLGFRPKLIIVKRTDNGNAASHWRLIDMTINPYNVADTLLYANSSAAELTGNIR